MKIHEISKNKLCFYRLTGFYAFVIFFLSTVWRHLKIGPNQFLEQVSEECSKSPWVNLLYINNFDLGIENQGQCLGQTWYLANDMQFFLLAPPIVYITWKWKKIGMLIIGKEHTWQKDSPAIKEVTVCLDEF